jgi:arylsulfatase
MNTWPDAGMTPFRNEKNSMWEGAYRVPCLVRWPDQIPAGTVLNDMASHLDWFTTLLAAAGVDDIADRLKAGTELNGREYKAHLDGENMLPYWTGQTDEGPRKHYFYFSDEGDLCAIRVFNWKIVFLEQRATGGLQVWREPLTQLRLPLIFNLRTDPFERANLTSNTYEDWLIDRAYMMGPAQFFVAAKATSLAEFPRRQEPASFTIEKVLAKIQEGVQSS